MKLSETPENRLAHLTDEQTEEIVFGRAYDDLPFADVALLLGTRPDISVIRAEAAAKLYLSGRVPYIIPTGGVKWEKDGKKTSEARFMADVLLARGVPEDAIILEEEALTTKENMIFGTLKINRCLKIQNTKSCIIITSASHLRRSLALAKLYLPRSIKISGCPADSYEGWRTDSEKRGFVLREVALLKGLIDNGLIDDIEY